MIEHDEFQRVVSAYITMAQEDRYRPAAPGDGFGSCDLTDAELQDPTVLEAEAERFARSFLSEGETFYVGCPDYSGTRALVYMISAAHLLCGAAEKALLLKVMELATREILKTFQSRA